MPGTRKCQEPEGSWLISIARSLDDANALRPRTLGALADVELDLLAFAKVVETTSLASGHVKEDVLPVARLDKTETSVGESLDLAFCHPTNPTAVFRVIHDTQSVSVTSQLS